MTLNPLPTFQPLKPTLRISVHMSLGVSTFIPALWVNWSQHPLPDCSFLYLSPLPLFQNWTSSSNRRSPSGWKNWTTCCPSPSTKTTTVTIVTVTTCCCGGKIPSVSLLGRLMIFLALDGQLVQVSVLNNKHKIQPPS